MNKRTVAFQMHAAVAVGAQALSRPRKSTLGVRGKGCGGADMGASNRALSHREDAADFTTRRLQELEPWRRALPTQQVDHRKGSLL